MHETRGYAAEGQGGEFAVLETTLTPELVLEGQARELVHQIQNLRREVGLAVDDRIALFHDGGLEPILHAHRAYIERETLAVEVRADPGRAQHALQLDGRQVRIGITKVVRHG